VSFNGDREGALVTFSSHAEAQAAYRSTEAALNNRFMKVFWHKDSPTSKMQVKDQLAGIVNPQRALTQCDVKEVTETTDKEHKKVI